MSFPLSCSYPNALTDNQGFPPPEWSTDQKALHRVDWWAAWTSEDDSDQEPSEDDDLTTFCMIMWTFNADYVFFEAYGEYYCADFVDDDGHDISRDIDVDELFWHFSTRTSKL